MKLISWNVNGLRACLGKGFLDFFNAENADVFCLQETKMQPGQADLDLPGYEQYWNSAVRKGYSGTAVFTRIPPLSTAYGIGLPEQDSEGRAITLEFEDFYLVTVYTPNAQRELTRLDYRMEWEDAFRAYVKALDEKKPVVICGDLNVAHEEIDLKNPKPNRGNAGFTDEERAKAHRAARQRLCRHLPRTSTPTRWAPIPGGPTCTTRAPTTRAGASTISSSPNACAAKSATAGSARKSSAATTAPWSSTSSNNLRGNDKAAAIWRPLIASERPLWAAIPAAP